MRSKILKPKQTSTYFSKYKTVENYGKYYSFVTIEGVDVGTKKLSKLFNPVRDTIRYAGDIELELSLISSDYEQMILMKPRFYVDYMGKIIYCFESTNVVPKKTTINEVYTVYVNQGKIVTDENGERQEVKDRYGSDGSLCEVLSIDNLDSTIREDFGL